MRFGDRITKKSGNFSMKNEIDHLEHSTYRCQDSTVLAPKDRRKGIDGKIKADRGFLRT